MHTAETAEKTKKMARKYETVLALWTDTSAARTLWNREYEL
jgi:hypothetical protein